MKYIHNGKNVGSMIKTLIVKGKLYFICTMIENKLRGVFLNRKIFITSGTGTIGIEDFKRWNKRGGGLDD